jgi:hypothetical protein
MDFKAVSMVMLREAKVNILEINGKRFSTDKYKLSFLKKTFQDWIIHYLKPNNVITEQKMMEGI